MLDVWGAEACVSRFPEIVKARPGVCLRDISILMLQVLFEAAGLITLEKEEEEVAIC